MIVHAIDPSSGTDKYYEHHQDVAASVWLITHNLNKKPAIQVFDSAGSEWEGEINYISLNQLTITFTAGNVAASFGGKAILN